MSIVFNILPSLNGIVLAFCVVTVLVWMYNYFTKQIQITREFPPSVGFRLPVIGHLHLLTTDIRISLRRFRKQTGDIYGLYFGSQPVVVISGLKSLKAALINNSDCLLDRPSLFLIDKITNQNGLVFSSGEKWKEHRQLTVSALKHLGMGRTIMQTTIQKETTKFVRSVSGHLGSAIDPSYDVSVFTTNIMTSLLYGKTYHREDEAFRKLVLMLEENMDEGGVAGILNIFPVLAKLPGDLFKYKMLVSNNNDIHAFIEEELNSISNTKDHFAGMYLEEMAHLDQEGTLHTLSREDLITTISDLLFAGADDMTTAIRWCLAALVAYPQIQAGIYSQIRDVLGPHDTISLTDRANLSLLEAFYLEVLRFCNISVPTLPRAASRDFTLDGYHIPRGTMVMPDYDSVLMDTSLWGDPDVFRPDRHLDGEGKLVLHDGLTVFSLGKRNCVGQPLAKMELFIFLGTLIQNYEISSPDNLTFQKVDGLFGLSHRPKPFRIICRERLT